MACNYGRVNTFLLVDKESTFNTPVSPTKDLGIIGDYNVDLNNNPFEISGGVGTRELASVEPGNYEGTMSLNGTLNSGAIVELFFNQATDTETTGDYKHVFIDDDGTETMTTDLGSFTIQENYDSTTDITLSHGGCNVNTLDITVELNAPLTFSAEILTTGLDTGTTAGTKVSTTTKPLIYSQSSMSLGDEGSESTISNVQSFSVSLTQNLERVPSGLGGRTSSCHIAGIFGNTGEFTKTFNSKTELERFLGGTAEAGSTITKSGLIFEANNGVALGSGRKEIYYRAWGVLLTTSNIVVSETGPVEATFNFTASTLKDFYMVDQVSTYF